MRGFAAPTTEKIGHTGLMRGVQTRLRPVHYMPQQGRPPHVGRLLRAMLTEDPAHPALVLQPHLQRRSIETSGQGQSQCPPATAAAAVLGESGPSG